ncbi:MAG TPA: alpha-glucan family phosphorylase [Methanothrix sp.]|nr:alpha-glucan family phosphorylase [Methanothrix sp.]HPJ83178.1 alpha-glucan family phosphorylase [Methanothrix sp.]HPR67062.1 alpha-glucan family phosphorylase [Methanothrix sp.]
MDKLGESSKGAVRGETIAYFSMEIGLSEEIPTYAGGLGTLAGDTVRSCADLGLPLVAVTLTSRKGSFRQELDPWGRQIEHPAEWDPSDLMERLPERAQVWIGKRDVAIAAWQYVLESPTGGAVPVLFLDTDLEENSTEDRDITDLLYGGDERYRLKQEIVLGIGGVRILEALGFRIRKYHMNEGHSSLLALELLERCGWDPKKVQKKCVFTTHTPVEAGHDKFSYDLAGELIEAGEKIEMLKRFGGTQRLNMTLLALNLSNYINGVAKKHRDVSRAMFPGYAIHSVTNGVHSYTWTCPLFRKLYDRYLPGWANEPELLVRVDIIPDELMVEAHATAKKDLIDFVNRSTGAEMDPEVLTLGFARRSTEYKRPGLLFSDLDRLRRINSRGEIQIIMAGKAHPKDLQGKKLIEEIFGTAKNLKGEIEVAYLENYDMGLAAKMVSGVDVWVNTPLRPREASGTSGMKAAHNGVINFSVLDGWWIEGWIEGVTGWSIGPAPGEELSFEEGRKRDSDDLYSKLEYIIVPTFYHRKDEWVRMMNNSIGMLAYYFNSHRMMRRYVTEAYL